MAYKKFLSAVFVIAGCLTGQAQLKDRFALGMAFGYRLNSGCILADYNITPYLVSGSEFSLDRYMGTGVGTGLYYYPVKTEICKPFLGLNITKTFGSLYSDDTFINIKIKDASYITSYIGCRFEKSVDVPFLSIIVKVGYKMSCFSEPNAYYVKGPENQKLLDKINNYIDNGFIFSIGVICNFGER